MSHDPVFEPSPLCIRRINKETMIFNKNVSTDSGLGHFDILPDETNLLIIYVLMYGQKDSPYEGGEYIIKIIHSHEYPLRAPSITVLTPNGRFVFGEKAFVCITNITSFHQEDWVATTTLLTILKSFDNVWHSPLEEDKNGANHLAKTHSSEIKMLASRSVDFNLKHYSEIYLNFKKVQDKFKPY